MKLKQKRQFNVIMADDIVERVHIMDISETDDEVSLMYKAVGDMYKNDNRLKNVVAIQNSLHKLVSIKSKTDLDNWFLFESDPVTKEWFKESIINEEDFRMNTLTRLKGRKFKYDVFILNKKLGRFRSVNVQMIEEIQ